MAEVKEHFDSIHRNIHEIQSELNQLVQAQHSQTGPSKMTDIFLAMETLSAFEGGDLKKLEDAFEL